MYRPALAAALLSAILLSLVIGAGTLRGEIVYSGSSISQDFDSLGTSPVSLIFSTTVGVQTAVPGTTGFEATKLAGSGVVGASLLASDGTLATGGMHSFGATDAADRALGAIASSSNTMAFGFSLRNGVADTVITEITVSFNQESWRTPTTANNTLTAAWGTSATAGVTTANYLTATGMTAAAALNMTLDFTASSTALDGNLTGNRVAKSMTFSSLNLLANDRFFLRWKDALDAGNNAGIGMDDMSLTFVVNMVPEAPAGVLGAAACGAGGLAWAGRRLRRRKNV